MTPSGGASVEKRNSHWLLVLGQKEQRKPHLLAIPHLGPPGLQDSKFMQHAPGFRD